MTSLLGDSLQAKKRDDIAGSGGGVGGGGGGGNGGSGCNDVEETSLVWMELILWLDSHLQAHTCGFAL